MGSRPSPDKEKEANAFGKGWEKGKKKSLVFQQPNSGKRERNIVVLKDRKKKVFREKGPEKRGKRSLGAINTLPDTS